MNILSHIKYSTNHFLNDQLRGSTVVKQRCGCCSSHLDGMTAVQCIQVKSAGVVCRDKLGPDVILGEAVVHTEILNPGCKALIKP